MFPPIKSDTITKSQETCRVFAQEQKMPWYALQIQSNLGAIAAAALSARGYETFQPLYVTRRRWSDRMKEVETPLFPGYLFCRFNVQQRLPILTTPGMIRILGIGKIPVPVEDQEISAIETILRSGLTPQGCPFLGNGSKVYIESGPLAGIEGRLIRTKNADRLVVSVSLLQRSVAVEIDRKWVRPVAGWFPFGSVDTHADARPPA